MYEYILREHIADIEYAGLDISEQFVELSRRKFPDIRYWCMDVLAHDGEPLPRFDYYAVMNGLFTVKADLPFDEMFDFVRRTVDRIFALVNVGIAFNVMSKHVDWERDDLFHLPLDMLGDWLTKCFGRHFVARNDYGLYEYTTYVYH